VTGEGTRPIAALAAAVLAAGALAACGDSGPSTTSSSTNETASRPASTQPGTEAGSSGSGDGASQPKPEKNDEAPSSADAAPLKVSGGGSAQFRTKGGDNSIQEFGEEGGETELEEAAASLHDFLVARAEEDWPAACSHLAKTVAQQLKQLASRSDKLSGAGCAGILAALTPALPPKVQKESTIVDAGSLRTKGEQAFLIYRGAEGTAYAIPMTPEGGAWKVAALAATPLS
jgi:hypothetical protein